MATSRTQEDLLTELLKRTTKVILNFVRFCPVRLAEDPVPSKEGHRL